MKLILTEEEARRLVRALVAQADPAYSRGRLRRKVQALRPGHLELDLERDEVIELLFVLRAWQRQAEADRSAGPA